MTRELIELEEAGRIILESCARLPAEPVPLQVALGRVLAADIRAESALPGFDNSAMDGFAVRAEDTDGAQQTGPVRLRIAGESRAGQPWERPVGPGEAVRISTGAVLPDGADAVLPLEEVTELDGEIQTAIAVEAGRYVRRAGDDIERGQTVLGAGTTLGPAELGVLASIGRDPVRASRRPRLSVVSTGDELVDPSDPLAPGQVRDSNLISLGALATAAGAELTSTSRVGDEPARVREVLAGALQGDVAVICGGVSVGEHDHVRAALEQLGAEQRFWGVALRPGRPTWFGVCPRADATSGDESGETLVFGLPGNPVSAVVTFLLLVRPALRVLSGASTDSERVTAVLDDDYAKAPDRTHALRVSLRADADGWHASVTRPEQASHILTSMLGADGLAMIPRESEGVSAGERVEVELIPRL